jgi:protein SCO1/2
MATWTITENVGLRRPWMRVAAGSFLGLLLLLAALLLYPPTARWIHSILDEPVHGRDVREQHRQAAFALQDGAGRRHEAAQLRGRVALVAFGYTHCPDACPTTLARMAEVQRLLGSDAAQVQVVFITVDPERDSGPLLQRYVQAFDPSFLALRGDEAATDAAARAFQADYRIIHYGKQILVEHTVDTYLVDPQGQIDEILPYDLSAAEVAQDVHALLRSTGLCWSWS